jgi:hypothetical protein
MLLRCVRSSLITAAAARERRWCRRYDGTRTRAKACFLAAKLLVKNARRIHNGGTKVDSLVGGLRKPCSSVQLARVSDLVSSTS